MNRRQLLLVGGALTIVGLTSPKIIKSQDGNSSDIPPGGTPSIIEGGIVQFTYRDGTKIRVYDDKLEIISSQKSKPEIKPRDFPIDVMTLTPPAVPRDSQLVKWLDTLAGDMRDSIKKLLRNDQGSMRNFDEWENQQSLTVYKQLGLRFGYIKRITRCE